MRREADDALVLEESDLRRIPARQRDSNKGTYGPLQIGRASCRERVCLYV